VRLPLLGARWIEELWLGAATVTAGLPPLHYVLVFSREEQLHY
jgi:hypothetical protein